MSRYTGPRLKIMRALGTELPGLSRKSPEARNYPPGQHGQKSKRPDYAAQPQLAVVALIELMSRFPASRSLGLAHSIVAHLVAIGDDARLLS